MLSTPSRRELLVAGAGLAATGLAGCSGSNSSSSADCETSAVAHGDGKILQAVSAVPEEETVLLSILFLNGKQADTDRLRLYDSSDELEYEIPTGNRRRYLQTIGQRPQHGRLRVVSMKNGEETDELVVDFNCWIDEDSAFAPKTATDSTES
ncbi:hypothetical protein [Haladaptatus sp. DYF46]|uniref:hypothetical protein n=1 Tax=Haladaptatus sp. DYF46 TaxID=2886041 RepID=UPI001E4E0699|nr:hypothetical protein [Haladaptatus sp. DYF46]